MRTPIDVLTEVEKYPTLGDIPVDLLGSAADILSSFAATLRHEVMLREARGGNKTFRGPDPKPVAKEKKKR